MWGLQRLRTLFGGPYNKDHSMLRSILGPPVFGNSHVVPPELCRIFCLRTVVNQTKGTTPEPLGTETRALDGYLNAWKELP